MNPLAFYREKWGTFTGKGSGSFPDVELEEGDYVVLDTELTGMNPRKDSIISLGAVKMKGGRIDLGSVFYRLVNPSTFIRHESIIVHGITPSEIEGKPSIGIVLKEFAEYCSGAILVGHYIALDLDFINSELERAKLTMGNPCVDTQKINERLAAANGDFGSDYGEYPRETNLFSLAKKYGIPSCGAHNSLNDAYITAQLFQRFLKVLPGHGVRTTGDLLKIGRP